MARSTGTVIENNFVQGFITERTALNFPANSAQAGENCVFDEKGRVTRRLGFDVETNYEELSVPIASGDTDSEFLWRAVAGDGDLDFLVRQKGNLLYFYDVSDPSQSISSNYTALTVDLDDFTVTGTSLDPATIKCQYAAGDGDLIVVNRACEPFFVRYNADDMLLTPTQINLEVRDFEGLDDGIDITNRPSFSFANLATNNAAHYYNILNQGWGVAISNWDNARSDMPSNVDYVALYRASETDNFDNARLTSNTPGNREAPKGHFILNAFDRDRVTAVTDDGFATLTFDSAEAGIDGGSATAIGNYSSLSAISNGDFSQSHTGSANRNTSSTTSSYAGYTLVTPTNIKRCRISGSNNLGYIQNYVGFSIGLRLYAKTGAAPANSTDGTLLGSLNISNKANESSPREIISSDTTTIYDHVWIQVIANDGLSGQPGNFYIAEFQVFTDVEAADILTTNERPQTTEFFAGRVWYSGVQDRGFNGDIYFSQIVRDEKQYGKCYQNNDPTNESFSDLLADDGGLISIPEAGKIVKLFAIQGSIIVFATNGVWSISGSSESSFKADDFSVIKISGIGTQSPQSFVNVAGIPYYWGEEGIYRISFDGANAIVSSLSVNSLSEQTIKEYITNLPIENKKNVKGAFDTLRNEVVWIYNEETTPASQDRYFNALVFNPVSNAFYTPWQIDTTATPKISGVVGFNDSNFEGTSRLKFLITTPVDVSNENITFAENTSTTYSDWADFATAEATPAYELEYTSFFETGYRLDGEASKSFYSPYVISYLDNITNSSCSLQAQFDFTNSGNSGKWSRPQELYRSSLTNRDVNQSRLKMRGSGRSMQLRFEGSGKNPFSIIGWSMLLSSNADV